MSGCDGVVVSVYSTEAQQRACVSLQWRIVSRAAGEPRRRYPCDYCGKLFRRQYDATQHERLHTGDLPYSCSLCNKKFINKSHYNYHVTRSLEHRTNKAGGRSRGRPSSVGVPAAAASDADAATVSAASAPATASDTALASASSSSPASDPTSSNAAPAATSSLVTSAYVPASTLVPAVTSASTSGLDSAITPAVGTAPDPAAEDSKVREDRPRAPPNYVCVICNKFFSSRSHYVYHMIHSVGHHTNLRKFNI